MQAVLCLLEDQRRVGVHDFVRNFLAAMCGETMHKYRMGRGFRHELPIHLVGREDRGTLSLFVLLAISSYPFQPAHRLLSLSWVAVLTLVALTVAVFVHMDRDEVLSWINKTPPGQVVLNREFASRLATYGLVPLEGMAAAQFPDIGRFLFFWVQPFMNALK